MPEIQEEKRVHLLRPATTSYKSSTLQSVDYSGFRTQGFWVEKLYLLEDVLMIAFNPRWRPLPSSLSQSDNIPDGTGQRKGWRESFRNVVIWTWRGCHTDELTWLFLLLLYFSFVCVCVWKTYLNNYWFTRSCKNSIEKPWVPSLSSS